MKFMKNVGEDDIEVSGDFLDCSHLSVAKDKWYHCTLLLNRNLWSLFRGVLLVKIELLHYRRRWGSDPALDTCTLKGHPQLSSWSCLLWTSMKFLEHCKLWVTFSFSHWLSVPGLFPHNFLPSEGGAIKGWFYCCNYLDMFVVFIDYL